MLFTLCSLCLCGESLAQNEEKPEPKPPVVVDADQTTVEPMDLWLDGRKVGVFKARVTVDGRVTAVELEPIRQAVRGAVVLEKAAAFFALQAQEGMATLEAINGAGLEAVFEENNFRVVVRTPAAWKPLNDVRFAGGDTVFDGDLVVEPADISGYLNIRGQTSYTERAEAGGVTGRAPLSLNLDGAWNFKGFVLEGEVFYQEEGERPWQRGDVRLVHDDEERLLRYTAGDLLLPTSGFQGFVPLGGISIQREFSIEPYTLFYPSGLVDLFLESDSEVEVRINGQLVRTLKLAAGSHRFRDFNLASGMNDVTLTLRDRFGKTRTIQSTFFSDPVLLSPGVHAFSYAFGFPQTVVDGEREYDTSTPTFSLFHRFGLTPKTTIGGNVQGSPEQVLVGGEATVANTLGTFAFDLAASQTTEVDPDVAARFSYTHRNTAFDVSDFNAQWSFAAQYTGRYFAPLGVIEPENKTAVSLSIGYSVTLPWEVSASAGLSYDLGRDENPDMTRTNLNFSRRLGQAGFGNVNLTRLDNGLDEAEYIMFVGFTLLFDAPFGGRQGIFSSFDSASRTLTNEWQYYSNSSVESFEPSARLTQQPGRTDLMTQMRYRGRRFEMDVRQFQGYPSEGQESARTDVTFGTAVVFAQDTFAVSRPVSNSFAIIAPRKELRGQEIGVNPYEDTFTSKVDLLGPAVVPDLSPYATRRIGVFAPDLADGLSLGRGDFVVKPTYRSGTLIRVGEEGMLAAEGVLLDPEGRPVALQAGDMTPEGGEAEPFFTDRQGRFYVENLKPGLYVIQMYYKDGARAEVAISKEAKGIVKLGNIEIVGPME